MGSVENVRDNMRAYDVINPIITFDGDVALSDITVQGYDKNKDIFYLNAIEDRGVNRYEEFLNKYFYEKLELNLLGKSNYSRLKPVLLTSGNKDGNGRHLRFDYYLLIYNLLEDKSLNHHYDTNKLLEVTIDYFKNQLRVINSYSRNRLNSEAPKFVVARYLQSKGYPIGKIDEINSLSLDDMKKVDFLITDGVLEQFTRNIEKILRILNNVKREIAKSEEKETGEYQDELQTAFMNCFTYDKFLMCFMKFVLDNNKEYVKQGKGIDNSLIELTQFVHVVDENKIKYTPSIKIYDERQRKVVNYNFNKLRADYEILYRKNKDAAPISQLSFEQVKKMGLYRNSEKMDKYREFMSKENEKIIETEFEILAPGEKAEDVRGYAGNKPKINNKSNKNVITDEEIAYRKFTLEQTKWARKIVGRDKFAGYIGYIYQNCLVLFEKFEEKGGLKNNATYVMSIDDFVKFLELIKLSKSEIIDYISNPNNKDVKRLYHNDTWADRLQSLINAKEITDDTIMKVESLPLGRK